MAFKIKHKGEVVEAPPLPDEVEEPLIPATHAGYLAWESYAGMAAARERAILCWERYKKLGEAMDQRGPEHNNYGKALAKLGRIEEEIVTEQVLFLQHERTADFCWRTLSQEERKSEGLCDWFGMRSDAKSLYGMWRQPFSAACVPPPDLHMLSVPLLVAVPEQRKAYLTMRMGGDYIDEGQD
jgi:hypothetical protein